MANGKMKIGIDRLLWKYPLFGGIVATWDVVSDHSTPTMAIGLNDRGYVLYFNAKFVEEITVDELMGVLHHEARHVVYGHLFLNPNDYADKHALTIAEEVTVNEGIPEPLPGNPILLRQYPQLKGNTDTHTRYGILAMPQHDENQKFPETMAKGKPGDSSLGDGSGQGDPTDGENGAATGAAETVDSDKKSVGTSMSSEECTAHAAHDPEVTPTLDDHSRWGEIAKQEAFARSILDSTVKQIIAKNPELSEYERCIIEKSSLTWGTGAPGTNWSKLENAGISSGINWKIILRRYIGKELYKAPSYLRPPRRFPNLLGIVPGSANRSGKAKVMAVIDTSGSMGDDTLAEISSELAIIGRDYKIIVVELDSIIHRVYRYVGPITNVHGRGENDFHPIFEIPFLRKHKPDLMVIFTDGFGPAPSKKPKLPVIWALTEGGECPVSWGKVIEMVPKLNHQFEK